MTSRYTPSWDRLFFPWCIHSNVRPMTLLSFDPDWENSFAPFVILLDRVFVTLVHVWHYAVGYSFFWSSPNWMMIYFSDSFILILSSSFQLLRKSWLSALLGLFRFPFLCLILRAHATIRSSSFLASVSCSFFYMGTTLSVFPFIPSVFPKLPLELLLSCDSSQTPWQWDCHLRLQASSDFLLEWSSLSQWIRLLGAWYSFACAKIVLSHTWGRFYTSYWRSSRFLRSLYLTDGI